MKSLVVLLTAIACFSACQSNANRNVEVANNNRCNQVFINSEGLENFEIVKEVWINDSIIGPVQEITYKYTIREGVDTTVVVTIPVGE